MMQLNAFLPNYDINKDEAHHRKIRLAAMITPSGTKHRAAVEVHFFPISSPRIDQVTARIIREVRKEGRFVVLPKGNGKHMTDPKAYRPLTLLPVFGNTLERVILR
ncbi:hypothetical protein EVAR_31020_1 [Eumeta japonica]|uniref:Uncharacterized protein n=1 Tax=Eumeta variegata TaxID=151549 RepID=A0A4C1VFF1_EUMVA|nr:hypothetical protein EVAR_31020_1 [Eumeta japonica]